MTTIFIFLIGLAIGSFLNVLIDRLPKGESVLFGRSYCDHCHRKLEAIDLIPVLSYIAFRGRCRTCNKSISLYYPIVELLTAAIFVFVWFYSISKFTNVSSLVENTNIGIPLSFYSLGMTISLLGIISSLIVIFFADLKYRIIPDEMVVLLFIFSLPAVLSSQPLSQRVLSSLLLFGLFYLIYAATKKRGMGFGDVKLAAAMGFMLGLSGSLLAVYLAFVFGGLAGLTLILFGEKGMKSKIAFGPFLVGGAVIMFFFGEFVFHFVSRFF